jgi:hypothetical protein
LDDSRAPVTFTESVEEESDSEPSEFDEDGIVGDPKNRARTWNSPTSKRMAFTALDHSEEFRNAHSFQEQIDLRVEELRLGGSTMPFAEIGLVLSWRRGL